MLLKERSNSHLLSLLFNPLIIFLINSLFLYRKTLSWNVLFSPHDIQWARTKPNKKYSHLKTEIRSDFLKIILTILTILLIILTILSIKNEWIKQLMVAALLQIAYSGVSKPGSRFLKQSFMLRITFSNLTRKVSSYILYNIFGHMSKHALCLHDEQSGNTLLLATCCEHLFF